ncbi:hypothetical protein QR680_006730 [Steinernema hermaphroditum]|uniref:Uncharacterized protein n=1 Tax=Steinernema hermaphroditum TaxID=289476 RepID=A0AA39LXV7_9BILA|nr:hypothetical protein QR680_006730 [Steinernema hermaphroditum]
MRLQTTISLPVNIKMEKVPARFYNYLFHLIQNDVKKFKQFSRIGPLADAFLLDAIDMEIYISDRIYVSLETFDEVPLPWKGVASLFTKIITDFTVYIFSDPRPRRTPSEISRAETAELMKLFLKSPLRRVVLAEKQYLPGKIQATVGNFWSFKPFLLLHHTLTCDMDSEFVKTPEKMNLFAELVRSRTANELTLLEDIQWTPRATSIVFDFLRNPNAALLDHCDFGEHFAKAAAEIIQTWKGMPKCAIPTKKLWRQLVYSDLRFLDYFNFKSIPRLSISSISDWLEDVVDENEENHYGNRAFRLQHPMFEEHSLVAFKYMSEGKCGVDIYFV